MYTRGGGQLPNPNECNSTLTSGTNNIYPYPYTDVNDRGHRLRITHTLRRFLEIPLITIFYKSAVLRSGFTVTGHWICLILYRKFPFSKIFTEISTDIVLFFRKTNLAFEMLYF